MDSNKTKQYITSAASILIMSIGIAAITRANLGSVAMLCPAYVISGIHGQTLSWGVLSIIMNLLFIAVECILLKKTTGIKIAEQISTSIVFGIAIDLAMWATHPLQWDNTTFGYTIRLIQIIAGTAVAGIGFCIHIHTNVLLSADGMANAFAKVLNKKFQTTRLSCDIATILVAIIFCVFYYGQMQWNMTGAGTLLSTIGVWHIFKKYGKDSSQWLASIIGSATQKKENIDYVADPETTGGTLPLVITIARTHGSGGHEIGIKVASRLGIQFYDKEIITATAQKLGMSDADVSDADQTYSIQHMRKSGSVFETQSQIIREAAKESCVIIGRCSDFVLKDRPYCLNIFVRCDEDYAVTMIRNKDNLSESQAREVIRLKNTAREKHYNHFTGQKWQDPLHYDLVINTAKIGIESAVDIVCNAVENILKEE